MAFEILSIRIPPDLKDAIKAEAERKGISVTALVIEKLAKKE